MAPSLSPASRTRDRRDHRRVLDGIVSEFRTGPPWRDPHAQLRSWRTPRPLSEHP
ncbi:transposase [Streptomyces sp. WAC08241]|uniref:transposase n=1 Tax=Streptomyces sp. WAC08241 TaxID=2487421 RepID=UPI000F78FE41|nr:hypothetical protein EF906_22610 [Streptomyces sp. WAC08241]